MVDARSQDARLQIYIVAAVEMLRAERHRQRLTQRDLAGRMANVRQPEISLYETLRVVPTVPKLREWAAALGLHVHVSLTLHDDDHDCPPAQPIDATDPPKE